MGGFMTQTEIVQSLSINERDEYALCKINMRQGADQFIKALTKIRDQRLYREEYRTFEAFCEAETDHTKRHIDRLISANKVNEDLGQIGLKLSESVARELKDLPTQEAKQAAVYLATKTAPGGKITAAHMKSTVKVVQDIDATGHVDIADGSMTAIGAAIDTETQERLARKKQHQQDNSQWERLNSFEAPAKLSAEKLTTLLADTDQAEIVKVLIFKRKVSTSGEGA